MLCFCWSVYCILHYTVYHFRSARINKGLLVQVKIQRQTLGSKLTLSDGGLAETVISFSSKTTQ
jgi:hypothetical protein